MAHNQKKDGMHPVVAGIAGVVAGAAAVAAGVAMGNPGNQKKMKEVASNVKEAVTDYVEDLTSKPVIAKGVQELKEIVSNS